MTKSSAQIITQMQDAARAKFGDHGFACGYLGSMLDSVLQELPELKREQYLNMIEKTTVNFCNKE